MNPDNIISYSTFYSISVDVWNIHPDIRIKIERSLEELMTESGDALTPTYCPAACCIEFGSYNKDKIKRANNIIRNVLK